MSDTITIISGQSNLSDSTKEALYELLRDVIYKGSEILEKDPNFYQGYVLNMSSEKRLQQVAKYIKERNHLSWQRNIDHLLSYADGLEVNNVVDAGCGPGISTAHIIDHFKPQRLVLVDVIPEMLATIKRVFDGAPDFYQGEMKYIEGRVEDLPTLVTESVDLVVMHSVMRYVNHEQQEQMLSGIREKTLRDGGMLLFDIPYEDPENPPIDFISVQYLAQHLHHIYDIPKLDDLIGVAMPTSSLSNNVDEAISKAGFRNVLKKPEVVYLDERTMRASVSYFVTKFFEEIKTQSNGPIPQTDYEKLESQRPIVMALIPRALSGSMMYQQSHIIYVATK